MTIVAFPTNLPRDQWSTVRDSCEVVKMNVDLWRERFPARNLKTLEGVVIREVTVVCTGETKRYDVWYEIPMNYPDCLKNPADTHLTSFTQEQIDKYR